MCDDVVLCWNPSRMECMKKVTVEQVLTAVERFIKQSPATGCMVGSN